MRILHIGKFYPPFAGGIEQFLADLLDAQQRLGLEVAALVHDQGPGWRSHKPAKEDAPPFIWRAPCLGRLLYAPISPSFPWWLDRVIRDFEPNLLHLHLPNTSAFSALLVPRARRLPWVVHWHADVVPSVIDYRLALAYGLYRPFEQQLLALSRVIIATSPPYLDASPALAPWRARCATVPLGLAPGRLQAPDASALAAAAARWGTGTGLRVLAIGRLTYYKGHDVLIRAAAALPFSRVLIVGSGNYRPRLEKLITELGLGARVKLVGQVNAKELTGILASCDTLCLPSLERTEAFGLVQLEAMRYGKPVVVSDIAGSGAPWVVGRAANGLLFPPGDAETLAELLGELSRDSHRRADLGQAGARALEQEFGIDFVAKAIHHVYCQIT